MPLLCPQGDREHQPRPAALAALTEAQAQQGLLPAGGRPALPAAGSVLGSHRNFSRLVPLPSELLLVLTKHPLVAVSMVPSAARPVGEPRPHSTSALRVLGGSEREPSSFLFPLACPADRVSEQMRVPGWCRRGWGGQHSGLPAQQVQERDMCRGSPLRHRAHPWGHQAGGEGVPGVHPVRLLAAWDI